MVLATNIRIEDPLTRSRVPFPRHEFLSISRIDEAYPFNDVQRQLNCMHASVRTELCMTMRPTFGFQLPVSVVGCARERLGDEVRATLTTCKSHRTALLPFPAYTLE